MDQAALEDALFLPPTQRQSYSDEWLRKKLDEGAKLNFVARLQDPMSWPQVDNKDGTYSTHKMASASVDGKHIAYPTIVWDAASQKLQELPAADAVTHALNSGEYLSFPDSASADYWAANYKRAFPQGHFQPKKEK